MRRTDRPTTTALLELRCVQAGISLYEMDLLTIGGILDIFAEMSNDDVEWTPMATQEDIDRLKR